jgi:chromosome segregation ATPase
VAACQQKEGCHARRAVQASKRRPHTPSPTTLQERLAAADSQQAQLEFDLSDKSASLQEAAEQATALKRQLGEAQQAQRDSEAAVAAAAAEAAAQLDASRQQSAQLATELAELEGRLEGAKAEAAEQATAAAEARQALAVAREQLAAAEADAESQRWAVGAAAVRSDELAAQLAVLRGTLLEKEQEVCAQVNQPAPAAAGSCARPGVVPITRHLSVATDRNARCAAVQLLLGRAEAQELRQQLAEQEESAEKLRVRASAGIFAGAGCMARNTRAL